MSEKRQIRSVLTDDVQAMTPQEFADFKSVVDPDGSKFYDDGPATPSEAAPDAPKLAPRIVASTSDTAPLVSPPAPVSFSTPLPTASNV